MSNPTIDALHDVHTATNDVLKGYREMSERAEPEIQTVIQRLTAMHERHAAEQAETLTRLRDGDKDDTSLQGTVNKVVVILRDWISDLDRDALPAVRQGEEALRGEFDEALQEVAGEVAGGSPVAALLQRQRAEIDREIGQLPAR